MSKSDDCDASEAILAAEQILANARSLGVPEAPMVPGVSMQIPTVKVIGASFSNAIVALDNVHFERCTFTSCTFIWNGAPFVIRDCQLNDTKCLRSDHPMIADALKLVASLGFLKDGGKWKAD